MENYVVLEMIGEGAFGKVYKGQRKCTNQIVAIKKIIKKGKKEKDLRNLRQEIDISRRLYHENIVQLLDSFETQTEFCLVSELCTGQLFEVIEEDKRLPESEIRRIAQQLSNALFYLHSNNIIHRDIKPQNILISANGVIKLCDFGFARLIDNKTMITSIKGTPLYMAPELLKESPYNKKADLWSLGVILYELFVGQPPFYTNSFPTLMNKIKKEDIKYPDSMSPLFKEFLKGLLNKNPKQRWDWDKILVHPYLKETEQERIEKNKFVENYRKWIIRLKNDKVFNLYESESYFARFGNDVEMENNTKNFSSFDINDSKTTTSSKKQLSNTAQTPNIISNTTNNNNINLDDYWSATEGKSNTEEGCSNLRKDTYFAEKVEDGLKNAMNKDQSKIVDKKLTSTITKILFNVLTKGKYDVQSLDITKNRKILCVALQVFIICQQEEGPNILLNDIIKIIGLYIKYYCYNSNGIDLSLCNDFLKYVPNVLNTPNRQPACYINMIKSVGLMITASNIAPKKSLLFYKSIIDFNVLNTLFRLIKNFKNQQLILTKSCLECIVILVHPVNGENAAFPFLKNNENSDKFEGYNEVKSALNNIETLKNHLFNICYSEKVIELFPELFEYEKENTLKIIVLKIILQFLRIKPNEMIKYFTDSNINKSFIRIINYSLECEDIDKKIINQLSILILIELVKVSSRKGINLINAGYKILQCLNYLNKTFQLDSVTQSLTFGLLAEWLNNNSDFSSVISTKYIKMIKDIIRNSSGKGKDENRRLEGTSFGYLTVAIMDYPLIYLERIFQIFITKEKFKNEIINIISEVQFEDILIEIISNSSIKNEISPIGINSVLYIVNSLIEYEYKMIIKKVIREHIMKQLIIFIRSKQFLAIQDWPGYSNNFGKILAKNIFINSLKIIKRVCEMSGISEEIAKTDFFYSLKTSFDIINKENYKTVIGILNTLISVKRDENVWTILVSYFSKEDNLKFIEKYDLFKELQDKELISDLLSFLSGLCRRSSEVYEGIKQINIFNYLINILENTNEPIYKSRVCNLLGNMCRHSDFFYEDIKNSGIINLLLKCCYDNDKATRKFACFAIGNAAFINDKLYENFRGIIPRLVELLKDSEDNTKANSAGALGNFVRCSDILCGDIIQCKAHEALINLAESEDAQGIAIIRVALFALGNFCNHAIIRNELDKINFRERIEVLKNKYKNDNQLIEHVERIKKKLK